MPRSRSARGVGLLESIPVFFVVILFSSSKTALLSIQLVLVLAEVLLGQETQKKPDGQPVLL
jgi:hypothetical protein